MEFYDTKFEPKPKPYIYNPTQSNDHHWTIYPNKSPAENRNLTVYMQNLDFIKEQAKLFNYVDRSKVFLPEDDNYFRFS